jgi:pretoxin HINT domain-containing protein
MAFENLHYLARGGGCFLEGTPIRTPFGIKRIEDFVPGDKVLSYNESTKQIEESTVERLDVLAARRYYNINYTINVTGEHPFYTTEGIKKVSELRHGDILITKDGNEVVSNIRVFDRDVVIYNLINVVPNHNYFAADFLVHNKGGGGCFLAGTQITMRSGLRNIEDIKAGDKIWTLNETTKITEIATVEELQVLEESGYYIINGEVKTTAKHPFYTTDGIKEVDQLEVGDLLLKGFDNKVAIKTIEFVQEPVTVYNLLNVTPNHNYLANGYLVHNKGGSSGGHASSSGGRSSGSSSAGKSTSSSTGSKSSSSGTSSYNSSSSRSTTSSSTKPGSKVTTSDGKTVQTNAKKPSSSKVNQQAGIAGVDGYTPRFTNGYSAPAGSVVYYPQHSFTDYLPWIYLFSQNSPSHDQATIVQPDGKEVQAQPAPEGVDGLAVLNWVLLIAIVAGIIGGIVWGVNKYTTRNEKPKKSAYDW